MKKKIVSLDNKSTGEIDLPDLIFNLKVLPDLIHQSIRYQDAKNRQGSRSTKTRSEVRGRAKKPFSQKGTGNARQGSSKPPNFRGGAVSMGPQNRDFSFALNKKQKKLAIKCALSEKNKCDEIIILDNMNLSSHKTKELAIRLNKFKFKSALFVYDPAKLDDNFKKASENIPKVNLISHLGINVKDLNLNEKIFIIKESINHITEKLS
ncbi:MAG: 50S ribosomal protein L4 [Alphaproteobacteria bacterium MarineAlpha5_Bin9]|nr:MAG: 50S ribosomal protein L4 [Alphaproteobacteria bacterium MarineAlpha5_Bin9]